MLVPLIWPMRIAFGLMIALALGGGYCLRRRRAWAFVPTIAAVLLYIPSCSCIYKIMHPLRYREFRFHTVAEITDRQVNWRLPPMAANITYHKFEGHHLARFKITEGDLHRWLADIKQQGWPFRPDDDPPVQYGDDHFERCFGEKDWQKFDDLQFYEGPVWDNGACIRTWHSKSKNLAYQFTAYF